MKSKKGSKPKDFKTKDGSIGARFEIPFHVKCKNCNQMWAKGVRFDSRKFKGNEIYIKTIINFFKLKSWKVNVNDNF